jgi:hypothetical protein
MLKKGFWNYKHMQYRPKWRDLKARGEVISGGIVIDTSQVVKWYIVQC